MWAIENSASSNSSNLRGNMVFKGEILADLLNRIHDVTDVSPKEVIADIREVRVTTARWIAIIALRRRGKTTRQIGDMMKRDYRAIGRMVHRSRREYEENAGFRALVDEVMRDS